MARIKNCFFFLVFCMFFLIGITIGKMMIDVPPQPPEPQNLNSIAQNQNSYLIIGVDDLSNPIARLESAWLLTLKSDISQIDLIPLYPVATAPHLNTYQSPHIPILVSTTDFENLKGIDVIGQQGVSWSGVIMHDLIALNIIVEIAGERHDFQSGQENLRIPDLPKAWEDPDNALQKQKNIIMFLCDNIQPFTSHETIQYLITYIPDHFRSTLSTDDLWSKWQLLSNIHLDLACHYLW